MIKNTGNMAFVVVIMLCMIFFTIPGIGGSVWADEAGTEFNIKNEGVKKDNIFNLFFGGAPLMPTEKGTVIIDAYLDDNNNQQWDSGEKPLEKAVICILDDIEYPIPAFIPGLENGSNYSLKCTSSVYEPSLKQKSVFIKKRGEIIKINVPCHVPVSHDAKNTSQPML